MQQLIGAGVAPARTLTRARLLLKADQSPARLGWTDAAIAAALASSQPTVARMRKRYVQEGLAAALPARAPRRDDPRRLDGEVELEIVDAISHQTVRRTRKQTTSNRT